MLGGKPEARSSLAFEIDLDQHGRFAADDPTVVSRLDHDCCGSSELEGAAVGVLAGDRAACQEADVREAAAVGARLGAHVLRPAEPGRINGALDPRLTCA